MTDITELAQRMKAAAVRAKAATEDYVAHRMSFTVCLEECKEFNDLSDGPDNILALVEALEKAQAQSSKWLEAYHKAVSVGARYEERIAELESSVIAPGILRCTECSFVQTKNIICVTADTITTGNSEPEPCPNGCGQLQPVNWKALAIQLMFTTKQGVSDLLEAKKRIAELEEAEQKLCAANVTLDARAELAERRLAEMESRTVTIEPFRSFVTDADLAALHRFAECCDDPESGGHDLEKEQVRRLEAIGALQRSGRISYITGFGDVLISITAGIKVEAE
ncbi:hypothetical protein WM003_06695 [Klebsiella michiganensis]